MAATSSDLGKNSRLYLLGAILLLWFVAICGRLVYLQIFSYGKFVKQAGHQQQRAQLSRLLSVVGRNFRHAGQPHHRPIGHNP